MNKKRVLLIGATGFVGSAIADRLDFLGITWVGLALSVDAGRENIYSVGELSDIDKQLLLSDYPYVVYAAGSEKPSDFEREPRQVIGRFLDDLSDFCLLLEKSHIHKFMNISSAGTVYGEFTGSPHKETGLTCPISWYGRAKLIQEMMFSSICSKIKCSCINARVTNPYGNKKKTMHGVVDVLIECCRNDVSFFYRKVNSVRDFIYAPFMAELLIDILFNESTDGIYNVGSGEVLGIHEIVSFVEKEHSYDKAELISGDDCDYDVVNNQVCLDKINAVIGKQGDMTVQKYIENRLRGS